MSRRQAEVSVTLLRGAALAVLLHRADAAEPQTAVEPVSVAWRHGAPPYLVRIVSRPDRTTGDSGLSLTIQAPGQPDVSVMLPGGLVPINEGLADSADARDNLLSSRYLYLTPRLHDRRGTPMLVVFGFAFASDPGGLAILALTPGGRPVEVFHSDAFLPTAFVDLNHDGVAEIVGKPTLGQTWGRCFETYDPYAVYRLPGSPRRAVYDTALSRAYNVAHYAGWAGPRAREDVAVVRCAPGGPRIMPATQASRLFR